MHKKLSLLGVKLSLLSVVVSPLVLAVSIVLFQIVMQLFLFGDELTSGKGPGPTEHFACFIPGNGWINCDLLSLLAHLGFMFLFAFPIFFLALLGPFLTLELLPVIAGGVLTITTVYGALMLEARFQSKHRLTHRVIVLLGSLIFLVGLLWPFLGQVLPKLPTIAQFTHGSESLNIS